MTAFRFVALAGLTAVGAALVIWQLALAPAEDRTTALFLAALSALAGCVLTLFVKRRASSRSEDEGGSHSVATILLGGLALFAMPFIANLPPLPRVSLLAMLAGVLLAFVVKLARGK